MGIEAEWELTPWATHMVYKGEGRWEEEYVIRPTNHAIRVRGECLKREAERIALEAADVRSRNRMDEADDETIGYQPKSTNGLDTERK